MKHKAQKQLCEWVPFRCAEDELESYDSSERRANEKQVLSPPRGASWVAQNERTNGLAIQVL